MILQTGGRALGATSTRIEPASAALRGLRRCRSNRLVVGLVDQKMGEMPDLLVVAKVRRNGGNLQITNPAREDAFDGQRGAWTSILLSAARPRPICRHYDDFARKDRIKGLNPPSPADFLPLLRLLNCEAAFRPLTPLALFLHIACPASHSTSPPPPDKAWDARPQPRRTDIHARGYRARRCPAARRSACPPRSSMICNARSARLRR
jgi:hypothetical protein